MTVAAATAAAGGCGACGSPLGAHQRYCIACGARVGRLNFPGSSPIVIAPAPRRAFRVPAPRSAAAVAATTLGFGIFVGVVIGPSLSGTGLATAPVTVSMPDSGRTVKNGGGAGGAPSASLGSPGANTPTQAAAPAPTAPLAPTQVLSPAPTTPTTTPTTTTPQTTTPPSGGGGGGGGTPPPAGATIDGTVVNLNPAAGSYVVATTTGQLFGVHPDPAAKTNIELPKVGTRVSVPVRPLFNGTFAEKGARTESGQGKAASFSGTVGYVDTADSAYTVSVKGASVLVHVSARGAAAASLPALGDYVDVTVSIEKGIPSTTTQVPLPDGCVGPTDGSPPDAPETSLVQTKISKPLPGTFLYFEGEVDGVCAASDQLVLSADDASESMADLTLPVADGIDVTKIDVGTALTADAELANDGTVTISGLSSDDGVDGADDSSSAQGDLAAKTADRARALGAGYATHDGQTAADRRTRRRAALR
jgi:hypothetical protein